MSVQKTYGKGFVTRAVAAHILQISKSELRRREADGIYPHVTDERGVVWYNEDGLKNMVGLKTKKQKNVQEERQSRTAIGYSAEAAAVVFEGLNSGKSLDEIIIASTVHPEAALAMQDAYGRVKGGIYLTREDLDAMGHLSFRAAWPPKDGKDLASAIEGALAGAKCHRCKERPARLCSTCIAAVGIDETPGGTNGGMNGHRAHP